jgi:protein MpaA
MISPCGARVLARHTLSLLTSTSLQKFREMIMMHGDRAALASVLVAVALAAPCAQAFAAPSPVYVEVVGKSLDGRPIECRVYGEGDDVFWLIATIHGNEAAGTPLVAKFEEWLKSNPTELDGRRVVIMPVANPDGFAENIRFNENGVDLNRNFPAGNWGGANVKPGASPLSEPESRALMRVLCQYFPNRAVSIHQPLNCIDYDGPAEKMAEAMAAKCQLPVKKLGSRPGSLGSFFGVTLGKPIITLELPADAGMDGEKLWHEYGEALIAALRYQHNESSLGK